MRGDASPSPAAAAGVPRRHTIMASHDGNNAVAAN
jgi:hypothetical protein